MNANPRSLEAVIRYLAVLVLATSLIGCDRFGGQAEAAAGSSPLPFEVGVDSDSITPIPEIWASGSYLPAGNRSAIADGEVGWIVTQPFQDDRLLLTKLTMGEGKATTIVLEEHVGSYSGAGLAPDGAGNLWITYGDQALRLNESTGKIDRWALSDRNAEDLG